MIAIAGANSPRSVTATLHNVPFDDREQPVDIFCVCSGRLGGGIFGDTHLAKWKEMTVAVKRLTLLVHENQVTAEAMKLMKNEVWFLR